MPPSKHKMPVFVQMCKLLPRKRVTKLAKKRVWILAKAGKAKEPSRDKPGRDSGLPGLCGLQASAYPELPRHH